MSKVISEGTFADLSRLLEHSRIPTELELDRFIRGHGYVKLAESQELPPFLKSATAILYQSTYADDMLKAGFRKVEL